MLRIARLFVRRGAAPLLLLAATTNALPGTGFTPDLNDETLPAWQARIEPCPEEMAWTRIPWRSNLRGGLEDAVAEGKPVLLWLLNGHPLGCT